MNILASPLPTAAELKDAIRPGHVVPAFQPLVDIRKNVTMGFEVLARWHHRRLGNVSPAIFVKLAEENSLIDSLTTAIMHAACARASEFPTKPMLAFNLSPVQFRNEHIVDLVQGASAAVRYPTERITLELTETALIEDEAIGDRIATRLKALGFRLALDDFGTGYSSLRRLHALPFDKIKIDASFVRLMDTDAASRKIVSSVIDLGHSLGLIVVAEGVETEQQMLMLRKLGCDVGQGYYLGRPWIGEAKEDSTIYPLVNADDITHHPSRQESLAQLEALYRSSRNALAMLDCSGRVLRSNARFAELADLTTEGIQGADMLRLVNNRRARSLARMLQRVTKGHDIIDREFLHKPTDRFFLATCTRALDEDDELAGISISLRDVTDLRKIRDALEADEVHYRRAMEAGLNVVWAARQNGEVYYMGPTPSSHAAMTVSERISDWYGRMHPEDRERVRSSWLLCLPTGVNFVTTFRVLNQAGQWCWVVSKARALKAANGNIESWLGTMTESEVVSEELVVAK